VDGDAYTIVGVMPPGFRHPGRTVATDVDMWATAGFSAAPFPSPPPRSAIFLPGAIARLKPDLTVAQAQQRLDGFTAFCARSFRSTIARGALVHPVGTLEGVSHWQRSRCFSCCWARSP